MPLQSCTVNIFPFDADKNFQITSPLPSLKPPPPAHLRDVLLFPLVKPGGVEHVEHHLEEIRDEMEIGLGSAAARVIGEGLLVGETQQQQFDVVHRQRVVRVTDAWQEEQMSK